MKEQGEKDTEPTLLFERQGAVATLGRHPRGLALVVDG